MQPETRVSRATMAFFDFACVATADATLQARIAVKSMFISPLTPELPNNLTKQLHLSLHGSVLVA